MMACGARSSLREPGDGEGGGGGGSSTPEVCNGLDDNGNGEIDEDTGVVSCGIGACRVDAPACVNGEPSDVCAPRPGSEEQCNGLDDDCNGTVDEGLGFGRIAGPHVLDPRLNYLAYGHIVPSAEGFFYAYSTSFDGSNPQPNVFWGTLFTDGYPLQSELTLTNRNMTNGLRLAPANGRFFASYCGRYGFEDQAATGLIDERGELEEFGVRPPTDNHCGAGTPDGIWTGERYLFAWTDNSVMDVRIDRAGASGQSLSSETLFPADGDLYSHPRFAMNGLGRVLLTYSVIVDQTFYLRVHRMNTLGQDALEPLTLESPADTNWTDTQIAAEAGGSFLAVSRGASGEPFATRFDAEGELIEGPVFLPEGAWAQHALASDPAGGFILARIVNGDTPETVVSRLDSNGVEVATWYGNSDISWGNDLIGWPTVAVAHGRAVVLYTSLASGAPDHPELHVTSFGCQPPTQ